ncbi:hypothetical protein HYPSUDRAFT_34888 [Hypholoma sublateritium FD-334 SS-4]|uniref:XPG-I domain-containing protein n=1 Tax=Hypholoma sublateritium (strain FD-334 SS-4) TaxID=945553 RepID=A0A0D2MUV0_HYPSF|nr:hypothetical protein HYPSUDRAFT_34888 [Hypholoma sublateritium FD-334 SS-4]
MGVPGLWEVLEDAGTVISIAKLAAIDGFQQNSSGRRAYRVGIDVSIWFEHAKASRGGDNPAVRGLFFQLAKLSKMSLIPLFVFDGRLRPKVKRGSKMGKSGSHELSQPFKKFLDAFGMEWREAPAEAEAELAFLNREGHIDAIMSDDCDTFIFGARTVFKNPSDSLSGNKRHLATNSKDKTDQFHTWIYRASDIENNPRVAINRGGLILFALLAGGDYDKGVHGIGKAIAARLARCEFGDELLQAYQNLPQEMLSEFLVHWRLRVNTQLREGTPRTSVVLPDTFPPLETLEKYAKPLHSGNKVGAGPSSSLSLRDRKGIDLGQVAHLCEEYFEWGQREVIIERFSRLLWPGAIMHVLRRSALEMDENERTHGHTREIGTPSSLIHRCLSKPDRTDRVANAFVNRGPIHQQVVTDDEDFRPLITQIVGSREHTSTDDTLEYRIEVLPTQLVHIANAGIRGTKPAPPRKEGAKEPKDLEDAHKLLRMWIPAVMLQRVHPTMVEQFVLKQSSKGQKKGKGKQRASSSAMSDDGTLDPPVFSSPVRTPSTSQSSRHESQSRNSSQVPYQAAVNSSLSFRVPSPAPARANLGGFEFTFEDPDRAQFDEVQFDDMMDIEPEDAVVDERPRTRFEAICDQIITAPAKSSKSKPRKRKAIADPEMLVEHRPASKKARKSLLEMIDEIV